MLSPQYIARLPNDIMRVWAQFEEDTIADFAETAGRISRYTDEATISRFILQQQSGAYKRFMERLQKYTGESQKAIADALARSIKTNLSNDEVAYKKAAEKGKLPLYVPLAGSALLSSKNISKAASAIEQMLETAAIRSLPNAVKFLTEIGYTGLTESTLRAYGATNNPQTLVKALVKKFSAEGLYSVEGASGKKYTMEAVVRRDVLSSINKVNGDASMARAKEVGQNLVYTSAHIGARPTHKVWQGRVFSLDGATDEYEDFYEATGYGEVDGLCGINCRHTFGPYFPGQTERGNNGVDTESNLEQYQLEQEERYNERMIRNWKRQVRGLEAAGYDASYEKGKVREWQARNRELIANNPTLHRDYSREQI